MASQEVQQLLKDYPSLKLDDNRQKVTCELTKHEMPVVASTLKSYVEGKKFKNASDKDSYEQYKPHLVPSNKRKHLHELFCLLTWRHIGKSHQDVERHVKGKRYKRALARWEHCQKTGEKFMPRTGGRQKSQTSAMSDSGSDQPWVDDEDNSSVNDDLSDLYPAEDFNDNEEETNEDDSDERCTEVKHNGVKKTTVHRQNIPVITTNNNNNDSDSDYDINVLDNNGPKGDVVSLDLPMASSQEISAAKISNTNKKKRKPVQQDDTDRVSKKKKKKKTVK